MGVLSLLDVEAAELGEEMDDEDMLNDGIVDNNDKDTELQETLCLIHALKIDTGDKDQQWTAFFDYAVIYAQEDQSTTSLPDDAPPLLWHMTVKGTFNVKPGTPHNNPHYQEASTELATSQLQTGDFMRVAVGQLKGLTGIIQEVENQAASVAPDEPHVRQAAVAVPIFYLHTFFKAGDYVKIIYGRHFGEHAFLTEVTSKLVTI
ncbi:hypothetical protein H0H87_005109 [Tephrocybe sp. NHM501043]|nr:hypothetical protein H0H87_005109 [Tephrocybe sp. NHM501043]